MPEEPYWVLHNNIGAIGPGSSLDQRDQFGTFMPGNDGGPPPLNLPDAGTIGKGSHGGSGAADSGALSGRRAAARTRRRRRSRP